MEQMDWVIPPPGQPWLAVQGGGRFPVRRVYCIARNYAAHAREMGGHPEREQPFFFLKPASALWCPESDEDVWPYPPASENVHHEVELVVALARGGVDLDLEEAAACIYGYAVGLDMTRRDRQEEAKALGRPWEIGKSFDAALPVSSVRPLPGQVLSKGGVTLEIDGERRQSGNLSDMIWSVAELVAYFSRYYRLAPGDLVLTGTPAGVGPVRPGNRLSARVEGVAELAFRIGQGARGRAACTA